MKLISEERAKHCFIVSMFLFLSMVVWICFGFKTIAALSALAGCGLLYSFAYPYFYLLVRGYYPSGYYVPKENVEKLTDRDYANAGNTKLSYYRNIEFEKLTLSAVASNSTFVYNEIARSSIHKDIIPFLAWVALGGTSDMDDSIKAQDLLNVWQSALKRHMQYKTIESKKDIDYDFEA